MTARSRQSVEYFAEEEKHVGMWQTRKVRNSAFWFRGVFHVVNLDSILKSRDITLLTKLCITKAMVFTVAMYGCESWTIKKAEH